jgi:hypothetical protein
MSTSRKLILLFPLATAAGIRAAVESGPGVERLPGQTLVPRDVVPLGANQLMGLPVRGGRSHGASVEVGEISESAGAITRGVAPGGAVVANGHCALAHDTRVREDSVEGKL